MNIYKKVLSLIVLSSSLYCADSAVWFGESTGNWSNGLDWVGLEAPTSGSTAIIGTVGNPPIIVDTNTCVAKSLLFSRPDRYGVNWVLDAHGNDINLYKLALHPLSGTAISVQNSTEFSRVPIQLTSSGTIYLGKKNVLLTLTNGASIRGSGGSVSLEVTGSGSLLIGGYNGSDFPSLASVFSGEALGTVSIRAASITNGGYIASAPSNGTIGHIILQGSAFENADRALFAYASSYSNLGSVTINCDTITNSYVIASSFNYSSIKDIHISGNELSNTGNGKIAYAGSNSDVGSVYLNVGSITNSAQLGFAYSSGTVGAVTLTGSLTNSGSAFFASFVNGLAVTTSSSVTNASTNSTIGPVPITMNGGRVNNWGSLYTGRALIGSIYNISYTSSTSSFTSGSVTGTGFMYLAETNIFSMPISQASVMVGYGALAYETNELTRGTVAGTLFANDSLNAEVTVTGSGSLLGTGTIFGSLAVNGSGQFIPGSTSLSPLGTMTVSGSVNLSAYSNTQVYFDPTLGNSHLNVTGGNLLITSPAYLNIITSGSLTAGSYTFISVASPGSITGTFSFIGTPSGYLVTQTPQLLYFTKIGPPLLYWTGNTSTNWSLGDNWSTAAAPTSSDVALFNGSAGGSVTVNINNTTAVAQSLNFIDKSFFMTASSTADLLTLSPAGGTAINFGSSTTLGTVQIFLDSRGTITLAPSTSSTITSGAFITSTGGLEISGGGALWTDSVIGTVGADLSILNVSITQDNSSQAMGRQAGTVSIRNSTLVQGSCTYGIAYQSSQSVEIINSTITQDNCANGLGFNPTNGLTIQNTTINQGTLTGLAGVGYDGGFILISGATITQNNVFKGIAFYSGAYVDIENVSINQTDCWGGIGYFPRDYLEISNASITQTNCEYGLAYYAPSYVTLTGATITQINGTYGVAAVTSGHVLINNSHITQSGTCVDGIATKSDSNKVGPFPGSVSIINTTIDQTNSKYGIAYSVEDSVTITGATITQISCENGIACEMQTAGSITLENTTINQVDSKYGIAYQTYLDTLITGATITQDNAVYGIAYQSSGLLTINNSQITTSGTTAFAFLTTGTVALNNSTVTTGATDWMGPAEFHVDGGLINNAGFMYTGKADSNSLPDIGYMASTSSFINGSIIGSGQMYLAEMNTLSMPVTQGSVMVGFGLVSYTEPDSLTTGPVAGTLYANNNITAEVIVTGSGSLLGSGTIAGVLTIDSLGQFSPGSNIDPSVGTMTVQGTVNILDTTVTNFNFIGGDLHSGLHVSQGNLTLTGSPELNLLGIPPITGGSFVFASVDLPGSITGSFTLNQNQMAGYQLIASDNLLYIESPLRLSLWIGSSDTQWNNGANWDSLSAPQILDTALFNGAAGPGSVTVNIGTTSCIARGLQFSVQEFLLRADTSDPAQYLLTLHPLGGEVAMTFGSSTTINTAQIFLADAAEITIGEGALLSVENAATIRGSVSLAISGLGDLWNQGNLAVLYANNVLGTFSLSAGSVTNDNLLAYADHGTLGNVTITTNTFQNSTESVVAQHDSTIGDVTLTVGTLTNTYHMVYAYDESTIGSVLMNGTSIYNNGDLAFALNGTVGTVTLNASLTNTTASHFASFVEALTLTEASSIFNTSFDSTVGPAAIGMTGGTVVNTGLIYTGKARIGDSPRPVAYSSSTSLFTNGSISGTGSMLLGENNVFSTPITQGTVFVGYGALELNYPSIVQGTVTGTLFANSHLTSLVSVTGSGSLVGHGTIYGDVGIDSYGFISPGGVLGDALTHPGTMTIYGTMSCAGTSTTQIYFDNTGFDQLTIHGNLLLSDPAYLEITCSNDFAPVAGTYLFINATSSLSLYQATTGSFSFLPLPSQFNGFTVGQSGGAIYLSGAPTVPVNASLASLAVTSNQLAVATALDTLNGHTNDCLQSKITTMQGLDQAVLDTLLNQMQPAQFKGQEIVLEEMAFVVNDALSEELYSQYSSFDGYRSFIKGGYEHLSQNSTSQYSGFSTNAGYELLGFTYGHKDYQVLGALGAQQTHTDYKGLPSESSTASGLASFGVAGFKNRWTVGIDALFGYHFVNTSRTIEYFGSKAHSSHQAYSLKGQMHAGYQKVAPHCTFTPYDDLAYLYGTEKSYTEDGAECLSLEVKSSTRQLVRNTMGVRLEETSALELRPYIDLAYVFEQRFQGRHYSTVFVNTAAPMLITGIGSVKNYLKIGLGVTGSKRGWDYGVRFNGQYGDRFSETGVSVNVDRRF